jgi:hypothetical protein
MTSFDLDLSKYNLGWSDDNVEYAFAPHKGLDQGVVEIGDDQLDPGPGLASVRPTSVSHRCPCIGSWRW